jgi:hypothetical protein
VLFPQLQGKFQGTTRKDGARLALPKFPRFKFVDCYVFSNLLLLYMFRSLFSVYFLCVIVYCTTAIGCQSNCNYIYIYIYNCNLVDSRWQQYSSHIHTNSTQVDTRWQQYSSHLHTNSTQIHRAEHK